MTRPVIPRDAAPPPAGYRIPYERWSLLRRERFSRERADLAVNLWPIASDVAVVMRELHKLDGPVVTVQQVRSMVENCLTVRRPAGAHRGKRAAQPAGAAMSREDARAWDDFVELFEDDCQVIQPTPEMRRAVIAAAAAIKRFGMMEAAAVGLVDVIHTLRETRTDCPTWEPRVRALFGRDGDLCSPLAALIPALAGDPASPTTNAEDLTEETRRSVEADMADRGLAA